MTVAPLPPHPPGDAVASKPAVPDPPRRPPSPRSPLPESRVVGGSRFWALGGESSDEEDAEDSTVVGAEELLSPRSGPSSVTLGDFLSPVCQTVVSSKARAAGRRRQKFAPGGQGPRFLRPHDVVSPRSSSVLPSVSAPAVVQASSTPL
jgi:hypothetical protein